MAKFVSPIISQAAGSLGGTAFQAALTGNRFQVRTKPRNPGSPAQQLERQLVSQAAQGWQTLSPIQRIEWEQLAPSFPKTDRLGNIVQRSGYSLFMAVAIEQLFASGSFPTDPPSPIPDNTAPTISSLTLLTDSAGSYLSATILGSGFLVPAFFLLTSTAPTSPGRTSLKRDTYTNLTGVGAASDTEIDSVQYSTNGTALALPGQRTGIRLVGVTAQWLSCPPVYANAIVQYSP